MLLSSVFYAIVTISSLFADPFVCQSQWSETGKLSHVVYDSVVCRLYLSPVSTTRVDGPS